jgi:hypothetical protein
MKKLKAVVEIEVDIDVETFEQASECLYDILFDGLCRNAPCEFWIDSVEEK